MMMRKCFIGVDFGKSNVRFGIAGDQPGLKCFNKHPYTSGSPDEIQRQIFEGIDAALEQTGYKRREILGIGISVPAVVDRETGTILHGPGWGFMAGVSLTAPVAGHYGVPVVAGTDSVMATRGEQWAGVGETCDRFAVLAWGTGLGSGLVIDGKVQEYPGHLFPEFGHSRVSDDDWPCKCGGTGCVDTMVSGSGIAKHGRLAVEGGKETLLRDLSGNDPDRVTSQMVFDAAERGDAVATAILERVSVLLGRLCSNIVLAMQPEKIVIVGGLTERCPKVLDTIKRTMRENCWLLFKGLTKCEVIASELADTAGVLGAIRTARENSLNFEP